MYANVYADTLVCVMTPGTSSVCLFFSPPANLSLARACSCSDVDRAVGHGANNASKDHIGKHCEGAQGMLVNVCVSVRACVRVVIQWVHEYVLASGCACECICVCGCMCVCCMLGMIALAEASEHFC